MDRAGILYQIIEKDCYKSLELVDNWLYLFDRMPARMKIILDFKTDPQGYSNKEIAEMLNITPDAVRKQLNKAKKRLFHSIT